MGVWARSKPAGVALERRRRPPPNVLRQLPWWVTHQLARGRSEQQLRGVYRITTDGQAYDDVGQEGVRPADKTGPEHPPAMSTVRTR